ncbi:MAG: hypothetical protein KKC39_00415, partial [Candidatus Omnitrophica bacterium]|nr:hypothetical protein [Candidatus Omnitrophota bacterium]MCG2708374.1 hypothetical protein [Candidatus Omnitrophota bacterium]
MNKLKRYFITGLLTILPIFLTLSILLIIFRLIDNIIGRIINSHLKAAFGFSIPGLGFILAILIILIIGFVVSHLLSKRALPLIESWFLKLPGIRHGSSLFSPVKVNMKHRSVTHNFILLPIPNPSAEQAQPPVFSVSGTKHA